MADIAVVLMPDGPDSPVRLEPGIASGAGTVGGVRTEILREQYEVGEDTRDIAEMFRLDIHDVGAAPRRQTAATEDRVTRAPAGSLLLESLEPQ